ncbi:MAG: ribosome maturation factor RimM [Desulfobacterales bacterium]
MNKPAPKKEVALVGRIVGAHGVKGTSKISTYVESLTIFKPGTALLVCSPDGSENSYEIDWVKPHSRGALLALKDITSRDQAKTLVGSGLYIQRTRLPKLEDGAYYWFDLIGLKVYTSDDQYLGRLDSIIETGANDVYVVNKSDREILIPALKSVVRSIDIESRIMRVELPEGLDEV